MLKKILKLIGGVLGAVILLLVGLFAYLSVTEYMPNDIEDVDVTGVGTTTVTVGQSLTLVSWNIGYGGLGEGQDFFMDGGKMVRPKKEDVEQNMRGIEQTLLSLPADVYLFQEVDLRAHRSYNNDQSVLLHSALSNASMFAYNYNCRFVPIPLPPIGYVESGLQTVSRLSPVAEAQRYSLPVPFSWPVRVANIKRCLLVTRIPIQGSDKELVLVNLHLEAYDSGDGKAAQTRMLIELLVGEYGKGNYVIAGGDFNQTFPGVDFPTLNTEFFTAGTLEADMLPEGWRYAFDADVPTARLLNEPFNGSYETTQLYVIDGFILSPNVRLDSVHTKDLRFSHSDHQPVVLEVTLEDE